MKVYASLTKIYDSPAKDLRFEVLNELKNLSSRCDSNCLYHTLNVQLKLKEDIYNVR